MREPVRAADDRFDPAAMKIGDLVLYQGRPHYLRGLDPMSLPDRQAVLEDPETGEEVLVPFDALEPCPPNNRLATPGV